MITARAWAGKRYAVLGLARSGAATVAALVASGADVVAWDTDEGRRTSILPARGEGDHRRGPSTIRLRRTVPLPVPGRS